MLTKQEVEHIAKLARLSLTQDELGKFQKELSSILDYIEKLKSVDTSRVDPTSHAVLIENVWREDGVASKPLEVRKKLLEQFPREKEGYLQTESIFPV